jgi:tetratricopeptide (TPR) repeat protein
MRSWLMIFGLMASMTLGAQNDLFEAGNEAYENKEYPVAIELYDSILKAGFENSALYFNLANAYFESGAVAKAILNYERALYLDPADEEVIFNLSLAEDKRVDRLESMPQNLFKTFRLGVLQFLNPSYWAILGLILLFTAALGLGLYLLSRYGRMGFVTLLAGLSLGLFSVIMSFSHAQFLKEHPALIIMNDSVYVKSGPSQEAEDLFILHGGTKAVQVEFYENWVKIRLLNGKIGWLPASQMEVIF